MQMHKQAVPKTAACPRHTLSGPIPPSRSNQIRTSVCSMSLLQPQCNTTGSSPADPNQTGRCHQTPIHSGMYGDPHTFPKCTWQDLHNPSAQATTKPRNWEHHTHRQGPRAANRKLLTTPQDPRQLCEQLSNRGVQTCSLHRRRGAATCVPGSSPCGPHHHPFCHGGQG